MKKKVLLTLSIASLSLLVACANDTSSTNQTGNITPTSKPPHISSTDTGNQTSSSSSSTEKPPVVEPKTLEDAFKMDYSNLTIETTQVYDGGAMEEAATEFIYKGYTIVYDAVAAEMGADPYIYYHDYDGLNYMYFAPDPGNPNPVEAWLNKGYEGADVSLGHAYFNLNRVFEEIDPADATYVAGSYIISDPEIVAHLNATVFEFAWYNDIQYVALDVDPDTGYLTRIIGLEEENNDDEYVQIKLGNFNETVFYDDLLPTPPNEDNVMEYWEYKGYDGPVQHKYLDSITLSPTGEYETEGDKILLDIEEIVQVAYETLPEDADKDTLTWHVEDPSICEVNYSFTPNVVEVTGLKAGETTIYAVAESEEGEDKGVKSNELTIKVKPLAEQNIADAIYNFTFNNINEDTGVVNVTNQVDNDLPATVTSNKASIRQGSSDLFGDAKAVVLNPGEQGLQTGDAYLAFDFDDQQVSSLSFYYGMYYSSGFDGMDYVDKIAIETSNDGQDWASLDITEEVKNNISVNNKKLMEKSFEPASKVRLAVSCNFIGKAFSLALDSIAFMKDENCHDHVDIVDVPVESITLSASDSLKIGETMQITADIMPATATDKTLTYISSDDEIASVSSDGVLTAKKEGTVEVYATDVTKTVKSNTLTIEVLPRPVMDTELIGIYKGYTDGLGEEVTFTIEENGVLVIEVLEETFALSFVDNDGNDAIFEDEQGNKALCNLSYQSDNVLEVTANFGQYTINKFGTHEGLNRYIPATSITLTPDKTEYIVNDTGYVKASFTPSNTTATNLTYVTENTDIIELDTEVGTFTALKAGTAIIKATNEDGVIGQVEIIVKDPTLVSKLTITSEKTELSVGQTTQLSVSYEPEDATYKNVEFTSSNEEVAKVNSAGVVSAIGVGDVQITATATDGSGVSATIDLKVTAATNVIPYEYVGTYSGIDIVGTDVEITINADGTAKLVSSIVGEIDFTFSSTDGLYYYFEDANGYILSIYFFADSIEAIYEDEYNSGLYMDSSYPASLDKIE